MTSTGRQLLELAAQLLEASEREAVLGDLVEGGESAGQGLLGVLGLTVRRQAVLWQSWRPWLAAFGLALPGSLLLMGLSVSVSSQVLQRTALTVRHGLPLMLGRAFLLIAWSWTGGFVVGSVSRRTLWVSAALCSLPCFFCLSRFRVESLSRLCLLLFLPPAIMGVRHGVRTIRIRLRSAVVLAVAVTVVMILLWSGGNLWILDWALIWPAWYLAVTARRAI